MTLFPPPDWFTIYDVNQSSPSKVGRLTIECDAKRELSLAALFRQWLLNLKQANIECTLLYITIKKI